MAVPERLGKYPVTGVIGRGAMGVVYQGYDPVIKRPVALKTIRRELIDDETNTEELAGRFRKEAQAAGTLNHPGIVSIYEYGEDQGHAFIAMEFVEGNTLREYFNRGTRFNEADTVSIMSQLLDAMDYAHNHAVWHRDIKPANIIIMKDGHVKLTDFGIARIESTDRTQTNLLMGTPGFISPEQYLGQPFDHRVDIFAAGVVFYQLLTGQAAFRGAPEAIMHSVCYNDPEPPSQTGARPEFDHIAARALMKRPEDRYPTAGAFRSMLLEEYAEPVTQAVDEATIIWQPQRASAPKGSATGLSGGGSLGAGSPSMGTPRSGTPRTGSSATDSQGSFGTPTPTFPTGWDPVTLTNVESELAKFMGPIAKVLVRRAAHDHADIDSLVASVAEKLSNPGEHEKFVAAVVGRLGLRIHFQSGTAPGNSGGVASLGKVSTLGGVATESPVTVDEIDRVAQVLTTYLGPIARIVAKRAADCPMSRHDFCLKVAEQISNDADRKRFLREAGG